jgi:hypothetical protein
MVSEPVATSPGRNSSKPARLNLVENRHPGCAEFFALPLAFARGLI